MTTHRDEVVREGSAGSPKSKGEARYLNHAVLEALSRKTYLSTEEAAVYLCRFTLIDAVQPDADARLRRATRALSEWARVHLVPHCHMGRSVLFLRRDLDEAVNTQNREGVSHRRSA